MVISNYLALELLVRMAGAAPATSSFQARSSTVDLHPVNSCVVFTRSFGPLDLTTLTVHSIRFNYFR